MCLIIITNEDTHTYTYANTHPANQKQTCIYFSRMHTQAGWVWWLSSRAVCVCVRCVYLRSLLSTTFPLSATYSLSSPIRTLPLHLTYLFLWLGFLCFKPLVWRHRPQDITQLPALSLDTWLQTRKKCKTHTQIFPALKERPTYARNIHFNK